MGSEYGMSKSNPMFSTGSPLLDKQLGGGIPAGDIVALTAPPNSQTETIFMEFASAEPLIYFSTIVQDIEELRGRVKPSNTSAEDLTVEYLDSSSFIDDPEGHINNLPSESVIVIDPVDLLETGSREEYLTALNLLKSRLIESESVAILHCLVDESSSELRSLTLKRADNVWSLRQSVNKGKIETTLYIPKSRVGSTMTDGISIELDDGLQVDTSRNIA